MAVEYGWNTTTNELTEKVVEEKENVEKTTNNKNFNIDENPYEKDTYSTMLNSYKVPYSVKSELDKIDQIGEKCFKALEEFKNNALEVLNGDKYTETHKESVIKEAKQRYRSHLYELAYEQRQYINKAKDIALSFWDNEMMKSLATNGINKLNGYDLNYIDLLLKRSILPYKKQNPYNRKAYDKPFKDDKGSTATNSVYLTDEQERNLTRVKKTIADKYKYNHAVLDILNVDGLTNKLEHPLSEHIRITRVNYSSQGTNSGSFTYEGKQYFIDNELNLASTGGKPFYIPKNKPKDGKVL